MTKIDPRDFIGGPFEDCPKCGKHELGVLNIADNSYTRRCRDCWHTHTRSLPKLSKKIIYLDQFVISNVMKMLSANSPGHERAKSEPRWRAIFEAIGVLRSMQLVVCPASTEHHDESLISGFFEELRHTYEHFATGIAFSDSTSIQDMQITEAFECWLNKQPPKFDLEPNRITRRNPHAWGDRIFITVSGELPGYKQAVQRSRKNVHGRLASLFKRWQAEKSDFEKVFEFEKSWYATSILQGIEEDRKRMEELQFRFARLGPLPRYMPEYSRTMNTPLMYSLQWMAELHLVKEQRPNPEYDRRDIKEQAREKAIAFVQSGAMNETPSNILAASLYAALARKAATGQKKLPDEGMVTDIRVLSTLLPYCDAMFVDNFCRSLLHDVPKKYRLPYRALVFSPNTVGPFLEYLASIRASVSPDHLKMLTEVYGPKALEPPKSIYGIGSRQPQSS